MTNNQVEELSPSLDLSYHLSEEGKLRRVSPLKGLVKYIVPENILLAQGLPRADSFTLQSYEFDSKQFGSQTLEHFKIPKNQEEGIILPLDKSMQYGNGKGLLPFIDLIRQHMLKVHTAKYSNWDIVLTTGNTDGLYSSLTLLANRGDPIVVAKWGYPAALEAFRGKGLNLLVADIDEEGLIPESIEKVVNEYHQANPNSPKCRLIYTVPTGQNPTGATMSLKRRQEFYNCCKKLDLMILEDDPYYFLQLPTYNPDSKYEESEFTQSTLLPSLYSLDTDGRVIRMDSFSKVMGPGFRTAWITAPKWFVDKLQFLIEVSCQQPSGLSQSTLSQILYKWGQDGFIHHLNQIRKEFTQCRDRFVTAVKENLGDKVIYTPTVAGMFGWLRLNIEPQVEVEGEKPFLEQLFDKLIEKRVIPVPGYYFDANNYKLEPTKQSTLTPYYIRLCYSYVDANLLIEGVKLVGEVLDEVLTN